ncbi:MAG: hypothetical protein IKL05_02600 [Clostridia bacterium]|nr:hypothetical protein [Clostridia bacterium]
MKEKINAFYDLYNSDGGKEILALGEKIKKLDKSNESRLHIIILLSVVSMTALGFFALGVFGAVLFFGITVIASFGLYYSSKKNILLKYLTFYRRDVPRLIAMADGVEVKAESVPDNSLVSALSDRGKLAYRMCHRYGDLYIGFAKFMVGSEPVLQGVLYYTEGNCEPDQAFCDMLKGEFSDCTIKCENGKALLFIPFVQDYLNGRVEMKDDLSFPALLRQYDYYLLGKGFKNSVNGVALEDTVIFHEWE